MTPKYHRTLRHRLRDFAAGAFVDAPVFLIRNPLLPLGYVVMAAGWVGFFFGVERSNGILAVYGVLGIGVGAAIYGAGCIRHWGRYRDDES
jgi:hypothetical protein